MKFEKTALLLAAAALAYMVCEKISITTAAVSLKGFADLEDASDVQYPSQFLTGYDARSQGAGVVRT